MKRRVFEIANCRERAKSDWLAYKAHCERKGEQPETGEIKLVTNQAGDPELEIRGYVGWQQVVELDAILEEGEPARLLVRINSGGGSAFAGLEIANRLRGMDAHVTTRNESAAMSAAALIFMAGDTREVGDMGSVTMFHRAMGWIDVLEFGNLTYLKKVDVQAVKDREIDLLESLDETILDILTKDTKLTEAEALAAMEAEKNYTSKAALEVGIATDTYTKESKAGAGSGDGSAEEAVEEDEGEEDAGKKKAEVEEDDGDEEAGGKHKKGAAESKPPEAEAEPAAEWVKEEGKPTVAVAAADSAVIASASETKDPETAKLVSDSTDGTEKPVAAETSTPEGADWYSIAESGREALQ